MLSTAIEHANRGRNVLILMPDQESCNSVGKAVVRRTKDMDLKGSIYVRSSRTYSSMKSVAVDTVLIVGLNHVPEGVALAKERTRGSTLPFFPEFLEFPIYNTFLANLDAISDTDARHIYYVFRAMHDGACPHCGKTATTFHRFNGALTCPRCDFTITPEEAEGIERLAERVLKVRVLAYEKNRHLLVDSD